VAAATKQRTLPQANGVGAGACALRRQHGSGAKTAKRAPALAAWLMKEINGNEDIIDD